jgi:hypothetical protein
VRIDPHRVAEVDLLQHVLGQSQTLNLALPFFAQPDAFLPFGHVDKVGGQQLVSLQVAPLRKSREISRFLQKNVGPTWLCGNPG